MRAVRRSPVPHSRPCHRAPAPQRPRACTPPASPCSPPPCPLSVGPVLVVLTGPASAHPCSPATARARMLAALKRHRYRLAHSPVPQSAFGPSATVRPLRSHAAPHCSPPASPDPAPALPDPAPAPPDVPLVPPAPATSDRPRRGWGPPRRPPLESPLSCSARQGARNRAQRSRPLTRIGPLFQ
nr:vegetative cell wall protein gp1-like [Aegilops tauschii subsp. strangulata]